MTTAHAGAPVLRVSGIRTSFRLPGVTFRAVDDVNLEVHTGETVSIVGESGSGKTVTGLSILRLVPPPGEITAGSIELDGRDLLKLSLADMEKVRGPGVTMVFQNPKVSLDPFFRVGEQLIETASVRNGWTIAKATAEVMRYLQYVHVRSRSRLMSSYPHELSGGECQRAMLAMALLCRPRVLIADEATTSLDAIVQAEILGLIEEIKREFGMGVLLITHDFGVVAAVADTVIVMYAGQVVEQGPVQEVLARPRHPYTSGLINSVPRIDRRVGRLYQIEGSAPDQGHAMAGCSFASRCPARMAICDRTRPALAIMSDGRQVRCHLHTANGMSGHG